MRLLIETRWFTIDISTPQPDDGPRIEASGGGQCELAEPVRIGFEAPLHDCDMEAK